MRFPDRRFKDRRVQKIKMLWAKSNEIVRRVHLGESNVVIANALGVTPQNVSDIKNSDLARNKLEVLKAIADVDNGEVKRRIESIVPEALNLIEDVIKGSGQGMTADLALRLRYADKHLGRAGYGEIKKTASVTHELSRSDIEEIKERAAEAARNAGALTVLSEDVSA